MTDCEITKLVNNIREVAAAAFNPIPHYQAMCGTRDELSDKVMALAWDKNKLAGFASTVELYIPTVANILHLGLTVVRPEYRSNGLTHLLMQKAITSYILKKQFILTNYGLQTAQQYCQALLMLHYILNRSIHYQRRLNIHPSMKSLPKQLTQYTGINYIYCLIVILIVKTIYSKEA